MVQQKQIQLVSMRMWVQALTSLSELEVQHCHELWCRLQTQHGSPVAVAGLWCRLATVAQIVPQAWELPYAVGVALKRKKKSCGILKS